MVDSFNNCDITPNQMCNNFSSIKTTLLIMGDDRLIYELQAGMKTDATYFSYE